MSAKRADVTRAPATPPTTNRLFSEFLLPLRRKPRALPGVFRLALALLLLFTITQNTRARGDVGDLYVANTDRHNILQFNGLTGDFVGIFAERPPDQTVFDFQPTDLLFAPDGHLWVLSRGLFDCLDSVVKYDGTTGDFLGYVIPPTQNLDASSMSLGGPNGNLYLTVSSPNGLEVHEYDRLTGEHRGVALTTEPTLSWRDGRFAADGRFLVFGMADSFSPLPTFRAYDPSITPFTLVRENAPETVARKVAALETPDGGGYWVADIRRNRIETYDAETWTMTDVFIPESSCLPGFDDSTCTPPVPCFWEALDAPVDLAYGPNGNLYVCAFQTHVPTDPGWQAMGLCRVEMGAIHEMNVETGEQVRIIGKAEMQVFPTVGDPEHLNNPTAIAFKPMPGNFGGSGSGAAYQGEWQVDEADLARFLVALEDNRRTVGSESPLFLAANLSSFDFDRNGVIDCADWPPFAAAFEASRGYAPSPPLPETPVFIDALLGDESAVCVSDCNADGTVDGQDIASYLAAVLEG